MKQNHLPMFLKIDTPTPEVDKSMSPQELIDHRTSIAFEVKVVLSAYFQPSENEEIKSGQLAWWCDELQAWTIEQIVFALRKYNHDEPGKRPTPGHIVALLNRLRGQKIAKRLMAERLAASHKDEAQRDRPATAEQAAEIMRQAGFAAQKIEG